MVLAVLYAAALSVKSKRVVSSFGRKRHLRARLAELLSGEQRFNKRTFVLFAGVVSGIGLIFSASRGGMIAGAGGLLLIGLLFLMRREHRVKGWIVLVLFAVISIYALSMGVEEPLSRFESFYVSMEDPRPVDSGNRPALSGLPGHRLGHRNVPARLPQVPAS